MVFFWILWGFDALMALVILYFFFAGMADKSVTSFNIGMWLLLLVVLSAILIGSLLLVKSNHPQIANFVLSVLALPGMIFSIWMLLLLGIKDWK